MTILQTNPQVYRLLGDDGAPGPVGLEQHLARYGPPPTLGRDGHRRQQFIGEMERSGLTGRGGAGFPTARKVASVLAAGGKPLVVVNAMEGEPASAKDQVLISRFPHLVLDGAHLLAQALGAGRLVVCVANDRPHLAKALGMAIGERRSASLDPRPGPEVAELPGHYVGGEESALLGALAGKAGVPTWRPDKSTPHLVQGQPALVQNAETLAHTALIARYGARWFRTAGVPEAPGTCLVTLGGAVQSPGVVEVPVGTPITDVIALADPLWGVQAVLVGGYGGTWLAGGLTGTPYAPGPLRSVGASMGAGVLAVLPYGACGLRETARVARFMAAQSAGQCGPCLFGLPALADDIEQVAAGKGDRSVLERLRARCGLVSGRGACRHPDGAARLVQSALVTFGDDLDAHVSGAPCGGEGGPEILPVPGPLRSRARR